ncbi:uncharacterized protein K452DRAFT_340150 [Aplosporella prunicola CBS 121167]|uniref:Homing endonuclease LAGLIDADG domain-containing protein n=1 Tax=Aplosporella prunicola CBS 121167 TaxID=1176127 RepID=A0A6A6AVV2_9PEZI|nr:uncharacterized protein K452DRAFT_340150 [Aplosporella prunicola CBS 121167]KAF2135074.1 hypothetical protein K452DRAFT_340150 [Aplosporella prunicola CBS 121167]
MEIADAKGKTDNKISLSLDETKEIIFGSLLGDAKLEMPPRGLNARFGFTQAEFQKDYFISVSSSLSAICSGKYRESSYLDKRTGKTYKSLIMQDGARGTSKGLYLCTDSFTHADVKRLTQYLIDTYNLKCSIHKAGGNHRIYILAKSVETVKNLILPYMHKSMVYKLGV